MALTTLLDSASKTISPGGTEKIKLYALDGNAAELTGQSTAFIQSDEAIIKGDLNATANVAQQQFGTGGILEEDMTVHSPPTTFNDANFTTSGIGITTQSLLLSTHSQFVAATVPNMFIETGTGNDTLVGLSGTNVLDGGTGQNTYYGGSGANTFIADARTTNAGAFIANMKDGDNAIVAGTFTSISEAITPSGLDFQLTGAAGQPSAEVLLEGAPNTHNLQVGLDTGNGTGVPFFFIHDTTTVP